MIYEKFSSNRLTIVQVLGLASLLSLGLPKYVSAMEISPPEDHIMSDAQSCCQMIGDNLNWLGNAMFARGDEQFDWGLPEGNQAAFQLVPPQLVPPQLAPPQIVPDEQFDLNLSEEPQVAPQFIPVDANSHAQNGPIKPKRTPRKASNNLASLTEPKASRRLQQKQMQAYEIVREEFKSTEAKKRKPEMDPEPGSSSIGSSSSSTGAQARPPKRKKEKHPSPPTTNSRPNLFLEQHETLNTRSAGLSHARDIDLKLTTNPTERILDPSNRRKRLQIPKTDFNAEKDLKSAESKRVKIKGHQGLFVRGKYPRGTILGWYTGTVYHSNQEQEQAIELAESLPNEDLGRYYFLDGPLKSNGDRLYLIDGSKPDPHFGGPGKCLAAYANHSRLSPNVDFVPVRVNGLKYYANRPMALVALKDLEDEEIFADYGDDFHDQLAEGSNFFDRCSICKVDVSTYDEFESHETCKAKDRKKKQQSRN